MMTDVYKELNELSNDHYEKYREAVELGDRVSATVHLQISVLCTDLKNILTSGD